MNALCVASSGKLTVQVDNMMKTDTAKYKPVCCYGCGKPFLAYTFSDTRNMRIDGKMYAVPVFAVPCMRCDDCNIAVTDGSADEAIEWAYKKYICENRLDTPWLRFKRWIIRWSK